MNTRIGEYWLAHFAYFKAKGSIFKRFLRQKINEEEYYYWVQTKLVKTGTNLHLPSSKRTQVAASFGRGAVGILGSEIFEFGLSGNDLIPITYFKKRDINFAVSSSSDI